MSDTKTVDVLATDWYERRHELRAGMVFNTNDGVVMLDRTVPGDGTRWYVADWSGDGWSYYESTVEPGDLKGEPLEAAALRAVSGEVRNGR